MTKNIGVVLLTLVLATALLSGEVVPRTIDGTRIHVSPKKNLGLQANGRQTVLFVEDPAGHGVPSPDQYWTAVLDSLLGVSNYGWFGPTAGYGDNGPNLATMQGYELVIWNCYDCWDYGQGMALTSIDQGNIASYLGGGGKVWLIGQDILYTDVPLSWMQTNFNLQSVAEDYNGGFAGSSPFPVEGAGELSGYGFSFLVDWGSDVFPDDITPNGSAHVVIHDAVNNADPAILSNDWSSSFWTVDGRNPTPWADWQEMVNIMFGGFGILGVAEDTQPDLPSFGFSRITPNPAVRGAAVSYSTSKQGHVTIGVYDVAGRLVRTLVDEFQRSGRKTVTWDGKDNSNHLVSAGVYFYRLTADGKTASRKMVVVR